MTLLACVRPGNLNRGSDIERGASLCFVSGINLSSRLYSSTAARLLMLLIPVGTGRRSQRGEWGFEPLQLLLLVLLLGIVRSCVLQAACLSAHLGLPWRRRRTQMRRPDFMIWGLQNIDKTLSLRITHMAARVESRHSDIIGGAGAGQILKYIYCDKMFLFDRLR